MNKTEFQQRIQEIGKLEDVVQMREQLATLSTDASTDYDQLATLTETNQNLADENEKVRAANMKLWLQLGDDKSDDQRRKDQTGHEDDKPEVIKESYEELYKK